MKDYRYLWKWFYEDFSARFLVTIALGTPMTSVQIYPSYEHPVELMQFHLRLWDSPWCTMMVKEETVGLILENAPVICVDDPFS